MKEYLPTILATLTLGLLIYFFYHNDNKHQEALEYWEQHDFRTDTVQVEIDYNKLPKPHFEYKVPPAQVHYYAGSTTNNKLVLSDSLIQVIDSLQNHIYTINELYLKLYPSAYKLIYGEFSRDSLTLDLLGIDGKFKTLKYATNYNRFSYQWKDSELKANPVSVNPNITPRFTTEFYGYAGYQFIDTSPIIGLDYSLKANRLRLSGNTFVTIESKPTLSLQGTLGYRFK
jgi:hypothetical protein